MPFYDLYCPECDKESNILASVKAKTEKTVPCPECGSFDLKTVYKGAPAYIKSTKEAQMQMPECPKRDVCGHGGCRHAN